MLSPSRVRWSARPGSLDPEGLESTVITEQPNGGNRRDNPPHRRLRRRRRSVSALTATCPDSTARNPLSACLENDRSRTPITAIRCRADLYLLQAGLPVPLSAWQVLSRRSSGAASPRLACHQALPRYGPMTSPHHALPSPRYRLRSGRRDVHPRPPSEVLQPRYSYHKVWH
jgi:hypothetical protein